MSVSDHTTDVMSALPPVPADDLAHIIALAETDLRTLTGRRLFVTGGTGFIGTWLLEAITAANDRLGTRIAATVLTRDAAAFARRSPHLAARKEFTWHGGDVRSFTPPPGAYDHIIHGATTASAALNAGAPREMFSTIVEGTAHVLDFAARCGADQLYLSSGAVYGRQPADLECVPETWTGAPDPLDPGSAYAEGKRAAECLCAMTAQVPTKIARCFAFLGPHLPLDAHFAAGNFLRDALRSQPIVIEGDGRPLRSYLHPADLIVWLLAILVHGTPLRAYNVGSEQAVSIAVLAERIARLASSAGPVRIIAPAGTGPAPRYVPETQRARAELGLEQSIGLDDAIASTLRWLLGGR